MILLERGKCSWFGGPEDMGVSPSEDTALWETWDQVVADDKQDLFLGEQPEDTTGLARRLDPETFYLAMRWDYDLHTREELLEHKALVYAPLTGRAVECSPADWGPHEDTGRIADLSPGAMEMLGIDTDDEVVVIFPFKCATTEIA